MFFIYSEDDFLIKKQVNKLIDKANQNNDYEVFYYSLIDDSIFTILEQINTYSLFSSKKIIVINDSWFVNESKIKLHKDFDTKYIEQILEINNQDIEIIFTLNSEKFSKKLKIAKLVDSKLKILKLDPPNIEQKKALIIKKFETNNIKFENNAIEIFLDRIPNDLSTLTLELNKLIDLNQYVNNQLIYDITSKYFIFDTFEIANCFISQDIIQFLKGWQSYKEINKDVYSFLALLTSNFVSLRNIVFLKTLNYSNQQIATTLGLNPYRITKLLEKNKMNVLQINDKIKLLYLLEQNIKKGIYDNKVLPELQFLKMFLN